MFFSYFVSSHIQKFSYIIAISLRNRNIVLTDFIIFFIWKIERSIKQNIWIIINSLFLAARLSL